MTSVSCSVASTLIGIISCLLDINNNPSPGSQLSRSSTALSGRLKYFCMGSTFALSNVAPNISLSLIFGATLDSAKVEPIQKYFNLPDSAVQDLLNCEQGEGLLLISSRQEIIPIRVEATEQEKDIIKGKYQHKKPSTVITSRILPEYESLRNHHGVILKEWIEGNDSYLIYEGWE